MDPNKPIDLSFLNLPMIPVPLQRATASEVSRLADKTEGTKEILRAFEREPLAKKARKVEVVKSTLLDLIEAAIANPELADSNVELITEVLEAELFNKEPAINSLWLEHLIFQLLKAGSKEHPAIASHIEQLIQQLAPCTGIAPSNFTAQASNAFVWEILAPLLLSFINKPSTIVKVDQLFVALHQPKCPFTNGAASLGLQLVQHYLPFLEEPSSAFCEIILNDLFYPRISIQIKEKVAPTLLDWISQRIITDPQVKLHLLILACKMNDDFAWEQLSRLVKTHDCNLIYQVLKSIDPLVGDDPQIDQRITGLLSEGLLACIVDRPKGDEILEERQKNRRLIWEERVLTWVTNTTEIYQRLKLKKKVDPKQIMRTIAMISDIPAEFFSSKGTAVAVLRGITQLVSLMGTHSQSLPQEILDGMIQLFKLGGTWDASFERWVYFPDFPTLWTHVQALNLVGQACQSQDFLIDAALVARKIKVPPAILENWRRKSSLTFTEMGLLTHYESENTTLKTPIERLRLCFEKDVDALPHLDLIGIFLLSEAFPDADECLKSNFFDFLSQWDLSLEPYLNGSFEHIQRRTFYFSHLLLDNLVTFLTGLEIPHWAKPILIDFIINFHLPIGEEPSLLSTRLKLRQLSQIAQQFPHLIAAQTIALEELFFGEFLEEEISMEVVQEIHDHLQDLQKVNWLSSESNWDDLSMKLVTKATQN